MRLVAIFIGALMLTGSFGLCFSYDSSTRASYGAADSVNYVAHDQIYIEADAGFATQAASEGWPGDGTPGDPYIIQNYRIEAETFHGIYIGNTTAHFEILNCSVFNGSTAGKEGIYLNNADFGRITGCEIANNRYGILFYKSENNTIEGNYIHDNPTLGIYVMSSNSNDIIGNTVCNGTDGIYLLSSDLCEVSENHVSGFSNIGFTIYYSDYVEVLDNHAWDNTVGIMVKRSLYNIVDFNVLSDNVYGIELLEATSDTLTNNEMHGCGIFVFGGGLTYWNSHTIDGSNTVNGKPVRYLANANGVTVPLGAGQVILVSCLNIIVENQVLSNGTAGIMLGYSDNCQIRDNTMNGNTLFGVVTYYSDTNTFIRNDARKNEWGFYLIASTYNNVLNNSCSDNHDGITLDSSGHNIIIGNRVFNNVDCIYLSSSTYNTIYHNYIMNNTNNPYNYGTTNTWHNGYPSGGNYWDRYTGVDLMSGALQNLPGSDGIGDTPYTSFGGTATQDKYPLMASPVATEFWQVLHEGWNLISIPLYQLNISINSVLSSIEGDWDRLFIYQTGDLNPWKSNNVHRPTEMNQVSSIDYTQGFWINVTEPGANLSVSGFPLTSRGIYLRAGWNLVGYPSMNPIAISDALLGTGYDRPVEAYNATNPNMISQLSDSDLMKPGAGYWVHVPADTTWIVDW